MSTTNDSDLFVIERSGTQYQVRSDELSELNDTDLFVVERAGVLYKLEAQDLNLGPTGTIETPVEVLTPFNGAGLNDGQPYNPLSSAITSVGGSGSLLIETAEITGTGVGTNWTSLCSYYGSGATSGTDFDAIFDGNDATAHYMQGDTTEGGMQFTVPAGYTNATLETKAADGGAFPVNTFVNDVLQSANNGSFVSCGTVSTGDVVRISRGTSGLYGLTIFAFKLNGQLLIDDQTVLTFASDQNVSSFNSGDSIAQDSGHTPTTSAITNITANTNSSVTMYKSPTLPANLADIPNVGTVVNGGDNISTGNFLIVVPTGDAVEDEPVFAANGAFSFELKDGAGLGDGVYDTNGNRLGGEGSYGPTEWTLFTFGVNPSAIYEVCLPPTAAYTVFRAVTSGAAPTPVQTYDTTFTLTDNTDLENFRVGDTWGAQTVIQYVAGSSDAATAASKKVGYRVSGADIWAGWPSDSETVTLDQVLGDAAWNMAWWEHTSETSDDGTNIASRGPSESATVGSWKTALLPGKYYSFSYYGQGSPVAPDESTYGPVGSDLPTPITMAGGTLVTAIGPGNSINLTGGSYNVGDTVVGPTFAAATGTVGSASGSEIVLSSSTGRFITNAGKTVQKSAAYDVALAFADDSELVNIIGPATQVNADGSDFDLAETSAITNVGNALPTVLSLTDNTDLDKFEVGDVVNLNLTSIVTSIGAGTAIYDTYDAAGNPIGNDPEDIAQMKDQAYFNTDLNDVNKSGNKGIYFVTPSYSTLVVDYVGTPGDTITIIYGSASTGSAAFSLTVAGDVTEDGTTVTPPQANKSTFPKETLTLTTTQASGSITLTGYNLFIFYITGWFEPTTTTVSSIGASSITVTGGTWNVGDTVSKSLTPANIGTVVLVDGTTLYGASVTGDFYTGKYLKGAEITAEAPSPSEIVFTSMNGGTTAFTGTDANLSGRLWSLQSGPTATGPWTTVGEYLDTGVAASQNGATPWATAPTLDPNTFYRVKVTYQSENAESVVSNQNTFRTGDA